MPDQVRHDGEFRLEAIAAGSIPERPCLDHLEDLGPNRFVDSLLTIRYQVRMKNSATSRAVVIITIH